MRIIIELALLYRTLCAQVAYILFRCLCIIVLHACICFRGRSLASTRISWIVAITREPAKFSTWMIHGHYRWISSHPSLLSRTALVYTTKDFTGLRDAFQQYVATNVISFSFLDFLRFWSKKLISIPRGNVNVTVAKNICFMIDNVRDINVIMDFLNVIADFILPAELFRLLE